VWIGDGDVLCVYTLYNRSGKGHDMLASVIQFFSILSRSPSAFSLKRALLYCWYLLALFAIFLTIPFLNISSSKPKETLHDHENENGNLFGVSIQLIDWIHCMDTA
jgi:hypothetical protein